ncbi:hypothetical protein ACQKGD_29600 [Peribacillus frigoritolerans]|uniref:hypothetical protein n=1 Tax=Peribacillus frigoritolerans TaxID=450367 RepID=UPI003D02D4A0
MSGTIKINNTFSAKQGLTIALEISRYELSSNQIARIEEFINDLDSSSDKLSVPLSNPLLFDLDECVTIFKNSQSIHWIREDFVKEVLKFENSNNTYN